MGRFIFVLVILALVAFGVQACNQSGSTPTPVPTATAVSPTATVVVIPMPAATPVVVTKIVTVTVMVPITPTTGLVPVVSAAATQGVCPEVAVRTEPQGVLQSDGSFIAQLGNYGCVTLFEGRIWEQGKPIQPRHDIVKIDGAKDGFRFWEGNGWLLPANWDANQIACQLWQGKQQNWISQGITPLPVQFWNLGPLNCQATSLPVPTATVVSITVQANSSQSVQVTPSGVLDWAKVLVGVPYDRLETCPGEGTSRCVHVKDGPLLSVSVPGGYKYEGWDGSQVVMGNGPVMVKISGLTVRPR